MKFEKIEDVRKGSILRSRGKDAITVKVEKIQDGVLFTRLISERLPYAKSSLNEMLFKVPIAFAIKNYKLVV